MAYIKTDAAVRLSDNAGHDQNRLLQMVEAAESGYQNTDVTLLASAARTTTTASADQTNFKGKALIVVIDLTTFVTAASITVTIQGKDTISGKYYTLLVSAAITAVSTTVLMVGPGLAATANVSANAPIPGTWRVNVVHNNANSQTYSVAAFVTQ